MAMVIQNSLFRVTGHRVYLFQEKALTPATIVMIIIDTVTVIHALAV